MKFFICDELQVDLHQELGQLLDDWNRSSEGRPSSLVVANRVFGSQTTEFKAPFQSGLQALYSSPALADGF